MIVHLQNKKRIIALLIALCCGWGTAWASYNFSIVHSNSGQSTQTLYFKIIDATNHHVKVVYPGNSVGSNQNGYSGFTEPWGYVYIPETVQYNGVTYQVTVIGDWAFANCSRISRIIIPHSVYTIGDHAYYNCSNANGIDFADPYSSGSKHLTTIGNYAFYGCNSAVSYLTFPSTVTTIGDYAFYNCTGIKSVDLSSSDVTTIGNFAFYSVGSSQSSSYAGTFLQKYSNIPIPLATIGNSAFERCNFYNSGTLMIPATVTSIGNKAFFWHENWVTTNSVSDIRCYSESITYIGSDAFKYTAWYKNKSNGVLYLPCYSAPKDYCLGYKGSAPTGSLTINTSTTLIAASAFYNCTGVTSMTLPSSMEVICNAAFNGCTGLSSINVQAEIPPTIGGNNTFNGVDKTIPVTVPCGSSAAYLSAQYWSSFSNIQESGFVITATSNPSDGGSVSGAGIYCNNASCTLSATANSGYAFVRWTKNGYQVSTDPTFTITVSSDATYVANFVQTYTITASASPTAGGSVSGAGTYNNGTSCTLTATANSGYAFVNWTKNGTQVSTNQSYTFTVNSTNSGAYVANFVPTYTITATANPTAGGTISGAGTYNQGASCTLTATPATGYTFTNWKKGNTVVSTSLSYQFTVTEAASYTATFTINSYTITATADPTAGGTVNGAGTYEHGSTCTLTASPATGYSFVNWTSGNSQVSTNASYQFTVTEARTLVANFAPITYTVTLNTNNGTINSGNVTSYTYGVGATLPTDVTRTGYTFGGWYDNANLTGTAVTSISTTATGNKTFWAKWTINSYAIGASANPTAGGTVSGAGSYNYGASCTLTATPATGYNFTKWTKNGSQVSTSASYTFTVNAAGTYVAQFTKKTYTISASANPTAGGTVTGAGTYEHGASCTLTAAPSTGYSFVNWTSGNSQVSTNASYQFTVTGARTLVANFSPNTYTVTLNTNNGTINSGNVTSYTYGVGATLPTDVTRTGYTFGGWYDNANLTGTAVTSISTTATGNKTFWAKWTINSYAIGASANPTAGGTVSGAGTYNYGASCTLTATPATGYNFTKWTKNGSQVSTSASYTFTVNAAGTYVAQFTKKTYTISASASPAAGGTVTGAGTYEHGTNVTLTATANEGYTFVNWKKGTDVVSTDASYQLMVTEAASYTATFTLNSYAISASANPTAGGTVTGAGTYNHGSTASLTATANTGYTFINWTENGQPVSTNPTYSFTVTSAKTLVANFSLNSYSIAASANPNNGGTVTGAGTYNHGETASLTASAAEGYSFVNWTEGTQVVFNNATYGFTVTGERTLVANFSLNSYTLTINYKYANGNQAAPTHTESLNYNAAYSVTSPVITGYTADQLVVNGTMGADDVTVDVVYSINSYMLTINYLYADGTTAATTHTENVNYNATYSVASPAITGYTADQPVVTGTMGTENVTIDVTYSINSYTLTINYLYADGTTAATTHTENVNYNATYSVTSPDITGYTADQSVVTGTMGTENVTVDVTYSINSYEVTATASPIAGGTVVGGGSYDYGSTAMLTATAAEGYTFVNWTENGTEVSTSVTYSFTVTEAKTLVANFSLNSYEVAAEANPTAGGTMTGAGTYDHGTTAILTATANDGYTFVNWTENGTEVSTSATYSFTVTEAKTLVANFSLNSYEVAAVANPSAGGTITGAGTYDYGTTATLTATVSDGYTFVNWTENGEVVSNSAIYSFAVTSNRDLVANFEVNTYEITATANPTNGGTVTGAGTYDHGTTVTLTATAAEGYHFVNWTKEGTEVSTSASYSFTVTEAGAYVAHFEMNTYEVTAIANPTGTVSGEGTYNHGVTVTLTATAAEGYTFVNWTENGSVVSTNATYSFTVTSDRTFVANFQIESYTIAVSATEGGTATGGGNYEYGTTITLMATAETGYQFVNWTENGEKVSTDASYSFTVNADRTLVANFVEYHVTHQWTPEIGDFQFYMALTGVVQIDGVEQTSDQLEVGVFCGEQCRASQMVELFELPEYGGFQRYVVYMSIYGEEGDMMTFKLYDHNINEELDLTSPAPVAWTQDPNEYDEFNPYVLNFTSSVSISATINPEGAGSVLGTGEYAIGSLCNLSATANEGFQFKNWTLNGTVVSSEPSYSFTVTEAVSYTANFDYVHTQALVAGWNWWGTYVELNGINGLSMLENSLGENGVRIQSRSDGYAKRSVTPSGYGYWSGSLRSICNEQMYMINTNNVCNVEMVGEAAVLGEKAIPINNGWNWIGFPSNQDMTLSNALQQFTPAPGDQIKGRSGYATYKVQGSYSYWSGNLRTLEHGQGYMYYSNSETPKTLVYSSSKWEGLDCLKEPEICMFTPLSQKFAHNMTVTAVVEMEGKELQSENYEVAAFVGDECRGSVKLMYVEPLDRYMAFLLVFGDEEESLRFALTDGRSVNWSDDHIAYSNDGIVGTLSDPGVLHFGSFGLNDNEGILVNIYPNPSKGLFNIEGKDIQKIEVINGYGQVVLSEEVENDFIQINLNDKAIGAYLLRVVTDNGVTTKKLVKNN